VQLLFDCAQRTGQHGRVAAAARLCRHARTQALDWLCHHAEAHCWRAGTYDAQLYGDRDELRLHWRNTKQWESFPHERIVDSVFPAIAGIMSTSIFWTALASKVLASVALVQSAQLLQRKMTDRWYLGYQLVSVFFIYD
jgi:hypothetical protein